MGFVNQLITVSPHTVGSQQCGLERSIFWIFVGLFWDESHEKSVKKPQKWSIPSTNMVNQHDSGNHLFWLVLWNHGIL